MRAKAPDSCILLTPTLPRAALAFFNSRNFREGYSGGAKSALIGITQMGFSPQLQIINKIITDLFH